MSTRGNFVPSRDQESTSLSYFVAGPENALTRIADASVTDQWARFNPLFVTGLAGVGKTRLLQSLLKSSKIAFPDCRSLWLTGADYARTITDGIDVDSLCDVRKLHRSVDLLILDGLHELASKPLAQQELIHTIDALCELDGQVIISSRVPLHELNTLLPELLSRLSHGLHVPLVPPTAVTREVILKELAKQNDVDVPQQIVQRLTSDPNRNQSKPLMVADLIAAVVELRCFAGQGETDSALAVQRIISQCETVHRVTAKEINKRVAKYFNLTLRELTGDSRRKSVVRARALSVYLIRTVLGSSFQAIGESLGGRDHTTSMHAFHRALEWIESDAGFARAAAEIGAAVK
ncbi:MAG: hypothetical protein H6822_09185 [Planctomycetaceae bacterium]|nr:hypothetical protein [Planctomycetales bacterium]MCB9922344.1 hypothetical protein [Planctomycetaceae bacterium]